MLYSRKQIDKAGQTLLASKDIAEVDAATKLIDDWRLNHLPVLKMLEEKLDELFKEENVPFLFSSLHPTINRTANNNMGKNDSFFMIVFL